MTRPSLETPSLKELDSTAAWRWDLTQVLTEADYGRPR